MSEPVRAAGLSAHARTRANDTREYLTPAQEEIVRAVARSGGRQIVAARRAGVKPWRVAAWCKATGNPWVYLKSVRSLAEVDERLAAAIAKLPRETRARIEAGLSEVDERGRAQLKQRRDQRATIKLSTSNDTTPSGHSIRRSNRDPRE